MGVSFSLAERRFGWTQSNEGTTSKVSSCNPSLQPQIFLQLKKILWVGKIFDVFSYFFAGLNISTALTSPQQQLIRAGMAEPNPDHLVNLTNHLGLPLITVDRITIDDARLKSV